MCWMPGIAVTCPPTTMVESGECSRTRRHISRTLPTFTMMLEMPTMSYLWAFSSSTNRSRVGKSSTAHGAEMLCWMKMMPQDRWNMRSENGPCSRVTWLW